MNEKWDEGEWLAQQLAIHERDASGGTGDARARSYRLIARILRERPRAVLGANFAAKVAVRAADAEAQRFESRLLAVLVMVFGLCAFAMGARFGEQWLAAARDSAWVLAGAACAGASWLIDQWKRRAG